MIEVHVYGKLNERLSGGASRRKRVLAVEEHPGETISALLERLGIDRETLYTVFLNGGLLATRNRMAPWLRYPQAQADVWDWENDAVLRPGDRLGLFGEDMASLVV